jgi:hypothetical protein
MRKPGPARLVGAWRRGRLAAALALLVAVAVVTAVVLSTTSPTKPDVREHRGHHVGDRDG